MRLTSWFAPAGKNGNRLLAAAGAFVLYALPFPIYYAWLGRAAVALALFPILLSAQGFGRYGGLAAAVAVIPLDIFLFFLSEENNPASFLGINFWMTHNVFIIVGLFFGYLSELKVNLQRELAERQETENRLLQAKREADSANRAKSDFLASMSHEIRTPLNAVVGLTETVLETRLDATQRDCLETVRESADHLLYIINTILDLSSIEAGRPHFECRDFDLHALAASSVKMHRAVSEKKGLPLTLEIAPETPRYVHGDPGRLRQILSNLLGNAIKFTDTGRVDVSLSGEVDENACARLSFSVVDTGVGITEDKIGRVFETFYQTDASSTRRHEGTGLGLAICRELATLMNGEIRLESKPGMGTTAGVTVRLPVGKPPQDADGADAPDAKAPGRTLNILLAEDNPVNIKVAEFQTDLLGHKLTVARNGARAVEKLRRDEFDLVLMDLEMPVMDGLSATRAIRDGEAGEAARTIPIIAMTAHALEDTREQCLEAGMSGYLSKPITRSALEKIFDETQTRPPYPSRSE